MTPAYSTTRPDMDMDLLCGLVLKSTVCNQRRLFYYILPPFFLLSLLCNFKSPRHSRIMLWSWNLLLKRLRTLTEFFNWV
jgi:hypothetical protein